MSQVETELARLRHSAEGIKFSYLRQYGYIIDFNEMKGRFFKPLNHFMYISEIPFGISDETKERVLEFPEGEYLCFFDTKTLQKDFIPKLSSLCGDAPLLTVASEYEETLSDYGFNSYFEIEIYIGDR